MGGGHYTATCKNAVDGKWYKFDDSHVSPADEEDVKVRPKNCNEALDVTLIVTGVAQSPAAYLLFYRRRTARPIGGKTREKTEVSIERGSGASYRG